ncbi:MAG: GxxExxY protein [Candidatus Buchananbacteria bacterium]|jgi:GxxExxY protein
MDNNIIYPELSYRIIGVLFLIHNELGRYAKEKQYGDLIAKKLSDCRLNYKREIIIGDSGNILDFLIEDKIILEIKAKRIIAREDYYQTQRYLQETGMRLGLLVNFRDQYLRPKRVVRIE